VIEDIVEKFLKILGAKDRSITGFSSYFLVVRMFCRTEPLDPSKEKETLTN